jgi:prepilin-type N-terminal cleavage/methylation domain-containing protein
MRKMFQRYRRNEGFTLIELVIVLGVASTIALVSGLF